MLKAMGAGCGRASSRQVQAAIALNDTTCTARFTLGSGTLRSVCVAPELRIGARVLTRSGELRVFT